MSGDFENLLKDIRKKVGFRLPGMAVVELPSVLTDYTKKRLLAINDVDHAGEIILRAIDKIDHGSLETVDNSVKELLKNSSY